MAAWRLRHERLVGEAARGTTLYIITPDGDTCGPTSRSGSWRSAASACGLAPRPRALAHPAPWPCVLAAVLGRGFGAAAKGPLPGAGWPAIPWAIAVGLDATGGCSDGPSDRTMLQASLCQTDALARASRLVVSLQDWADPPSAWLTEWMTEWKAPSDDPITRELLPWVGLLELGVCYNQVVSSWLGLLEMTTESGLRGDGMLSELAYKPKGNDKKDNDKNHTMYDRMENNQVLTVLGSWDLIGVDWGFVVSIPLKLNAEATWVAELWVARGQRALGQ